MLKKFFLSTLLLAAPAFLQANVHTFMFDGKNDIYGLTRQTSMDANDLTFVQDLSVAEEGVELSIKKRTEEGKGFALVNAGGVNAGLMVYCSFPTDAYIYPEVSLSVPNGTITGVKLCMSGSGLLAVDIPFNGMLIEAEQDGSLFYWNWFDTEGGAETVTFKWDNNFHSRFIHSIELTYSVDTGDLKPCGLNFNLKSAEAIIGETFYAPRLSNPHKLPIEWKSSDTSVAEVDENGNVTPVGGGKCMITASTQGDDTYAGGNAKYDLSVLPSASDILMMKELAPELYDRVYVNFPLTVTYAKSNFAFVEDSEGNAACIENIKDKDSSSAVATIYSVGDVLPAGWAATNFTINSSTNWQGVPKAPTESVDVKYPLVDSVAPEDNDRVVTLKRVTFTTSTPSGFESAYGTTPDGTKYEFQDPYNVGSKSAGMYDVTGVVRYSKTATRDYFYIAAVEYAKASPADPVFPGTFYITLSDDGLEMTQEPAEDVHTVTISGSSKEENIEVSLNVPAGWEGYVGMTDSDLSPEEDIEPLMTRVSAASADDWAPLDDVLEYGLKEGNKLLFPVDGEEHYGQLYLYKGDRVYQAKHIEFDLNIKKGAPTSIEGIDSASSTPRYYNLQGIEVASPLPGHIYIRHSSGTATKVVIQ